MTSTSARQHRRPWSPTPRDELRSGGLIRTRLLLAGCGQEQRWLGQLPHLVVHDGRPAGWPAVLPVLLPRRGHAGPRRAFRRADDERGSSRSFAIPQSACGIPDTALAYSLNVTVVPQGPLSYLTLWPTGQARPLVST